MAVPESVKYAVGNLTEGVLKQLYELHFNCRSHFLSADHYEKLDQRLTLVGSIFIAAVVAVVWCIKEFWKPRTGTLPLKGMTFVMIAFFCSAAITQLYKSAQSPLEKKNLHFKAASELKGLEKRMEAWMHAELSSATNQEKIEKLLDQFYNFINEQTKIDKETINAVDWTFSEVHRTLPEKWVESGKKLGKYFPDDTGFQWGYHWYSVEPYLIIITLATISSFVIWNLVCELYNEKFPQSNKNSD